MRPMILRIDRQFIQPIMKDEEARPLASSIIGIVKSLKMRIIAEGVESVEHTQMVSEMGCDFLEGFHFGKPKCAADLRDELIEADGFGYRPSDLGSRNALRAV
jgi:EAL domain-containing protein (putative c-di-GMP-specific phosphodiesterase class I)